MQIAGANERDASAPAGDARLLPLMMSLFFAFGFCTVLVDTLVPKLKAMFSLTYAEVMLTQFCFFTAYFIISVPAGWLLSRIGYLKGITLGLAIMAAGCLMFIPAAKMGIYPGFLLALFILASGVTTVQVAANPLTAGIGDPKKAPARLTLAQAFNSLATMVGPIFGSVLILSHSVAGPDPKTASAAALATYRVQEAQAVQTPFIGIAIALLTLAAICWAVRRWGPAPAAHPAGSFGRLLKSRRVALGVVSIFAYVGAEVSIGSAVINYLTLDSVLGLKLPGMALSLENTLSGLFGHTVTLEKAQVAGFMVSVYWGLAMVGRFIGAAALRRLPAGAVLACCAVGAGLLAAVSGLALGVLAAVTLLAIGLFNSIMFPTIFTLAIEDLGEDAPQASGLLCLAIVGGAVVPVLTGLAADAFGLQHALFVPVICYLWILTYGALIHFGKADPVPGAQPAFATPS
jgi:FHS family L-fucose permease-like MFS transporter